MQIGCDYEVSDTYRFRVLLLSFEFTMSNFLYKYLGIYFSRSLSFSYHINCYLKDGLCLVGWQDNFTVLECGRSWVRANGSNKYYNIGIYCFSAKHALRRESKDWLARNQDIVSEWGNMSRAVFRWREALSYSTYLSHCFYGRTKIWKLMLASSNYSEMECKENYRRVMTTWVRTFYDNVKNIINFAQRPSRFWGPRLQPAEPIGKSGTGHVYPRTVVSVS
jgi:hypothetical protein